LKNLDLSYTMLGDVGLESLPALTQLESLNLGGDRITGINLNFLKLLPRLKTLSLNGIQRRNAGACWTPMITDLDMETISLLAGLEDLNLGVGVSLGRTGVPVGAGNCKVTGGIKITDLGLAKLARLKNLTRLDVSGAKVTPGGLKVLEGLPHLSRLSLWNCSALDDSAVTALAAIPNLASVDLSYTAVDDAGKSKLATIPHLKVLYLTDTKVTPAALDAFHKEKPATFVSWAVRPVPPPKAPAAPSKKPKAAAAAAVEEVE